MSLMVKICGITSEEDLKAAADAGADAVGFVLAESPRRVSPEIAKLLIAATPPHIDSVVVLHHPQPAGVAEALELGANFVQTEVTRGIVSVVDSSRLLPVVHDGERTLNEFPVFSNQFPDVFNRIVFEAAGRGGSGNAPDRAEARRLAHNRQLILAGGLNPKNVAEAIGEVKPYGVDVSSGVESRPGIKDAQMVCDFVDAARAAAEPLNAGQQS